MTIEDQNQDESTITLKSTGASVPVSRDALEPTPQVPLSGGMAAQGQAVQPLASPREPFLIRNRWLILGLAVVLSIALVGAAVYFLRDQSVKNAETILQNNSQPVNTMASLLTSAYTVRDLRNKVGQAEIRITAAQKARDSLDTEISEDQAQLKADVEALLKADIQYLRAITKFAGVKKIQDARYKQAVESLRLAEAQIIAKGNIVEKRHSFPSNLEIVPDRKLLDKAESHLSDLRS